MEECAHDYERNTTVPHKQDNYGDESLSVANIRRDADELAADPEAYFDRKEVENSLRFAEECKVTRDAIDKKHAEILASRASSPLKRTLNALGSVASRFFGSS